MNNKPHTATVTWITYCNFGTFLQAYALQQTVLKLGYKNRILCDKHIVEPKKPMSLRKYLGQLKKRLFIRSKTARLYSRFKKKYLLIERETSSLRLNKKYQIMLCGSDQIWSPYLKFEPYYYLNFFRGKKIAYAPSVGTTNWTDTYIKNIKNLLQDFASLSVREADSAVALSQELGCKIQTVLDPTLLFDGEEWKRRILPRDKRQGGYILCYFLTPNSWYIDYVHQYAQKQNKRIKIFDTHPSYSSIGECVFAGPREFLSLINAADEVFTDSFHASIFSILFHKRFTTFKRFADGGERDQNLRLYNLLSQLGLLEHFIGKDELAQVHTLSTPDYHKVDAKLAALRADSLAYLKQSLNSL